MLLARGWRDEARMLGRRYELGVCESARRTTEEWFEGESERGRCDGVTLNYHPLIKAFVRLSRERENWFCCKEGTVLTWLSRERESENWLCCKDGTLLTWLSREREIERERCVILKLTRQRFLLGETPFSVDVSMPGNVPKRRGSPTAGKFPLLAPY